jgi:hypothetical protein
MWFSSLNGFIVNGRFTKISRIGFFLSHMLSHWVLQQRDFSHMVAVGFRYMVASTFWIFTIPAYCSWDFQNLELSGILAVVFTDNYFGYWLDVFFTEISQFFWFLAGCYFYGVPILWIQFGRFLLWLHSGFWVLYRVAP